MNRNMNESGIARGENIKIWHAINKEAMPYNLQSKRIQSVNLVNQVVVTAATNLTEYAYQ